ncbi:relaxase/mobilization nuclease domain-containing protein [Phytohabitans aurantiacus]|uniref:MobA/VirD2-like nuclease domain-containing protein n=1 Tax=Phytohabitans aurantiacus TaxID=3016789 RepID=A0ABQ5R2N6_9ACTN|nr:relaxase/mobilization nuclease domain-containing protein [Phytohabitans aurantiacus]GLI00930.1 hypothetical protein Pa4123_62060 [Phytohabitans aurantiacus]
MPNIVRGKRVGGLLRYLYGPGKREEHVNPHLVAAWDGAGPLHRLEPVIGPDDKRDFRRLVDLLEQPVHNGRNPPRRPVWHCSVRVHPEDRRLSDAQWAHIAAEVMAQAGLAEHGDARAVRWVAVRHGPDHIHIAATLVRQDRRTEYARNDRWKAQAACRNLEERYGLYVVGPADRTSHRRPKSPELNKARRTGRTEPARDRLRREVRFAAAAAATVEEFFDLLRQAGVTVEARESTIHIGVITGYKVALPDYTAADGRPIWYGGGRLAPDLSMPRLLRRWADSADVPRRSGTAAGLYDRAAEHVCDAAGDAPGGAVAAAYAAADVLTVVARHAEGTRRGPLHEAAEALDRAARLPHGQLPARTPRAEQLRAMSRLLGVAGRLADGEALFAMLRLILNLSLLADALADLRDSQRRLHQARAARVAARLLRAVAGAPDGPALAAEAEVPLTGPPIGPPTSRRDARRHSARPTTVRTPR